MKAVSAATRGEEIHLIPAGASAGEDHISGVEEGCGVEDMKRVERKGVF
jgi:hypothetical protein